jgi:hypothetical protein
MWRLNLTDFRWTWIGGRNVIGSYGIYGTKGVPDGGNLPGARNSMQLHMDPVRQQMFIMGGFGQASTGSPGA